MQKNNEKYNFKYFKEIQFQIFKIATSSAMHCELHTPQRSTLATKSVQNCQIDS